MSERPQRIDVSAELPFNERVYKEPVTDGGYYVGVKSDVDGRPRDADGNLMPGYFITDKRRVHLVPTEAGKAEMAKDEKNKLTMGKIVALMGRNAEVHVNPNTQPSSPELSVYRAISGAEDYDAALSILMQGLRAPAPESPDETADQDGETVEQQPQGSWDQALSFEAMQNYLRPLQEQFARTRDGVSDRFNEPIADPEFLRPEFKEFLGDDAAVAAYLGASGPEKHSRESDWFDHMAETGADLSKIHNRHALYISPAEKVARDYLNVLGFGEKFDELPLDAQSEVMSLLRKASYDPTGDTPINLVETAKEWPGRKEKLLTEPEREYDDLYSRVKAEITIEHPFSGEISAEAKEALQKTADEVYESMFLRRSNRQTFGNAARLQGLVDLDTATIVHDALVEYKRQNPNALLSVLNVRQHEQELTDRLDRETQESYMRHAAKAQDYPLFKRLIDDYEKRSEGYAGFMETVYFDEHWEDTWIAKRAISRVREFAKLKLHHAKTLVVLAGAATVGMGDNVTRQRNLDLIRKNRLPATTDFPSYWNIVDGHTNRMEAVRERLRQEEEELRKANNPDNYTLVS